MPPGGKSIRSARMISGPAGSSISSDSEAPAPSPPTSSSQRSAGPETEAAPKCATFSVMSYTTTLPPSVVQPSGCS